MSGPKRYFISPIPYENGMLYELPNIICVDEWPGTTFYTYVRERTCRVEATHAGPGIFEYELSCGHGCEWTWPVPPAFCPSCGARVEEEA